MKTFGFTDFNRYMQRKECMISSGVQYRTRTFVTAGGRMMFLIDVI